MYEYIQHQPHLHRCFEYTKNLIQTPHWTQQFQSICVGLGALFAGLGGLKIGLDWLRQERLKRKQIELSQRYPIDSMNKNFELVDTLSVPGKWWLVDIDNKRKYWIRNLETARDLGWTYSMVKHVQDKYIDKFTVGEPINTREL